MKNSSAWEAVTAPNAAIAQEAVPTKLPSILPITVNPPEMNCEPLTTTEPFRVWISNIFSPKVFDPVDRSTEDVISTTWSLLATSSPDTKRLPVTSKLPDRDNDPDIANLLLGIAICFLDIFVINTNKYTDYLFNTANYFLRTNCIIINS